MKPLPTSTATETSVSETKHRKSMFASYYDDVLAVALTTTAGLGAGWLMINKYFFRNGEKVGRFADARRDRTTEHAAAESTLRGSELIAKKSKIEKKYYQAVEAEMEKLGINSPINKFRSLAKHQKWEVAIAMTAVTGAAIGFISSYISNREASQQQQEMLDALNRLEENTRSSSL